ncbi:unnamed protein product [Caenorhabditis brenneri]
MAKRPNNANLTEEIISEAKRQTVAYVVQRMTTAAAREMRRTRPIPKCDFCNEEHPTKTCENFTPAEKKHLVIQYKLCFICLNKHSHHPAKCRTLRHKEELCTKKQCFNTYSLHHRTICVEQEHPQGSPPAGNGKSLADRILEM